MAKKSDIVKAVVNYCRDFCCCGQSNEVELCPAVKCPLWKYRKGAESGEDINNIINALKNRCFDCSCFDIKEVKKCEFKDCFLYPYRLQKEKKHLNEDELEKLREKKRLGILH